MNKPLRYLTILGIGALALTGCKENAPVGPIEKTVNGHTYVLNAKEGKITQTTTDEDNRMNFGVFTDIEGFYDKSEAMAKQQKEHSGVDAFIVAGDLCENESLRGEFNKKGTSNKKEMKRALEGILKQGLPVFVIPGNHDKMSDYNSVMRSLEGEHDNLFDMNRYRIADLDDADLAAIPGYHHVPNIRLNANGSHIISKDDYVNAIVEGRKLDDKKILVTHGPPLSKGKIDMIPSGRHVGDPNLNAVMQDGGFDVNVHGHIHEEGVRGENENGDLINPATWHEKLILNAGSVTPHRNGEMFAVESRAAILSIAANQAAYVIHRYK